MQMSASQAIPSGSGLWDPTCPQQPQQQGGVQGESGQSQHNLLQHFSTLQDLQAYLLNANVPKHYLDTIDEVFKHLTGDLPNQNQNLTTTAEANHTAMAAQDANNNTEEAGTATTRMNVESEKQQVENQADIAEVCSAGTAERPDSLQLCEFGDEDRLSWSTDTTMTPDPVYYSHAVLSPGETLV